ncbi:MAG: hypothetical protein LBT64_01185 [Puniceicoccales bacterium]|jgi:hypothetical protein|nr:hypothetical protein [Puniceicoccales bacterium]
MEKDKSKSVYKGISRIDSRTTKGWLVRGYKNGIRYSKLFSDGKLGGRESAFEKAKAFYVELSTRLKSIPSKPRNQKIVSHDKRNQTGVLGVSKLSKVGKNNKKLGFYSVTWRPSKGKQKCTSFSIAKYGEDEAFKKAVSLRFEKLRSAYGENIAMKIVGKENVLRYVSGVPEENKYDSETSETSCAVQMHETTQSL